MNPAGSHCLPIGINTNRQPEKMNSKIYVGTVMHQRHKPKKHILRYRVFSMLLNLEELPSLGRRFRFFSHNAFNLFSVYDKDFGGGEGGRGRGGEADRREDGQADEARRGRECRVRQN